LFEVAQWSHDANASSVFTQDLYSYTEETGSVLNAQFPDGSYRSQAHSLLHLVHHGDTPLPADDDLFVHVQFTVRYDPATGELTATHDRFTAECR
jgi:hypothetical protein